MLTRFRDRLTRFISPSVIKTQVDPNAPIALYFEPSGRVRPVTMKSLAGWTNNEYNSLAASMTRNGSVGPSEIGYAYISEVNVWVRRCIEIRATTLKRLTWFIEDPRTGKRLPDHPLQIAIDRSRHFMLRSSRSLDIWGELFLKPLENRHGYYSDVWWLNNLSVNFNIVNGFIDQFYYAPLHGGKPYIWPANEMCYIYTENAFDDLHGSSKILSVLQEANVHEEVARSAQAHFANDARPGIMFLPENDMNPDRAQEFINYWKKNFQGSLNTNKPVLLPSMIKTVQVLDRASLKDDVELRGSIRREICAAFGVPLSVAGAWDDANYQSAPEQRKSLYEDTIIPLADQMRDDLTRQLMPFYDDPRRAVVNYDVKALLALAEDKQQKAQALNSQLVSGGITLNQYREAMDLEAIPQGNVFYIPSGVIVTPVEKLGTMPPPSAPSPFGMSAPADVPPIAPETQAEPVKDAASMAVILSLANNVDLVALQNNLKAKFASMPIEWTAPDDFHITLVYVPSVDEAALAPLTTWLTDYPTPAFDLNVGSLASFDNLNEHALHFRIRRSADLEAYQEDVYLACQQIGLQTGQYSDPRNWKPHITMGYAAQRIPPVTFHSRLRVAPDEVRVSVERDGAYEIVSRAACGVKDDPVPIETPPDETPVPEPTRAASPLMDEIDAYEKFLLNRWGKTGRAFTFHVIDGTLKDDLLSQVNQCTEKGQIKRVFEDVREDIKARADEPDIVTPEQAQEWWGSYDRLLKTLGNDWLIRYMKEVWRRLESRLSRDISVNDVQALLEDFHPELIQEWTGTAEEPGVIAKLYMAGMGAGQASLERKRVNLNPNKAAELNIDWSLVPADAIAAVERYVGKLIRGIDQTTLNDVQTILMQWLESGGTLADLTRQLSPIFNDPDRAALIAQTESSRAYVEGAFQRWADVGVEKVRFTTVRDVHVCPRCSELAGQIGTIENGWDGLFIPIHPGCRCMARPVL